MATRCTISVVMDDGSIVGTYCHFDGYLSHVGRLLNQCYASYEMAGALVAVGDIASLTESIESSEINGDSRRPYYNFPPLANGQPDLQRYRYTGGQEYNYLFIDGRWHVCADDVDDNGDETEICSPDTLMSFGFLRPLSAFPICNVSRS
jgi:hypothetical protein